MIPPRRKQGEPLKRYLLLVQGARGRQTWSDDDDFDLLHEFASKYLPSTSEWQIVDRGSEPSLVVDRA